MLQRFNQMFHDLKLSQKFNVLLVTIFCLGLGLTGGLFWSIQANTAQERVNENALMLMQAMDSVRSYTNEFVKPELAKQQEIQEGFISETVPAFAATSVFSIFNESPDYREFKYREAALNPTNPNDRADEFESTIINYLREETETKQMDGYRKVGDGSQYYIARPIKVSSEGCLQCHSTPQVAPESLVETYGPNNGFGWELNEIVGAQIISVPAGEVRSRALKPVFVLVIATSGIFAIALYSVNVLLKRAVIDRLVSLSLVTEQIGTGRTDVDYPNDSKDEIGRLGLSLNRLKQRFFSTIAKLRDRQQ